MRWVASVLLLAAGFARGGGSPGTAQPDAASRTTKASNSGSPSSLTSPVDGRAESSRGESSAPGTRPTSAAPSEAPSMTASEAAEQVLNQTAEDIAAEMSPQVEE